MHRRRTWGWVVGTVAVLTTGGALAFAASQWGAASLYDAHLESQVEGLERVLVLGDRLDGLPTDTVTLDTPSLEEAFSGSDPEAARNEVARAGIDGIVVRAASGDGASVGERLQAYQHVPGFRGVYIGPDLALYVPDAIDSVDEEEGDAIAYVARRVVGGARPPRVSSFPESLRRVRNVEVMVMLRQEGRARLWRSARGASVARALLTAASVARQRWLEREQAMGADLDEILPTLDVEVVLLREDGTLYANSPAFLERVFTPQHGVAFEQRGSWRYYLPEATEERGQGSAVKAYEALFDEHGLDVDAFARSDLRLYRLVARPLGRSLADDSTSELPLPGGSDTDSEEDDADSEPSDSESSAALGDATPS